MSSPVGRFGSTSDRVSFDQADYEAKLAAALKDDEENSVSLSSPPPPPSHRMTQFRESSRLSILLDDLPPPPPPPCRSPYEDRPLPPVPTPSPPPRPVRPVRRTSLHAPPPPPPPPHPPSTKIPEPITSTSSTSHCSPRQSISCTEKDVNTNEERPVSTTAGSRIQSMRRHSIIGVVRPPPPPPQTQGSRDESCASKHADPSASLQPSCSNSGTRVTSTSRSSFPFPAPGMVGLPISPSAVHPPSPTVSSTLHTTKSPPQPHIEKIQGLTPPSTLHAKSPSLETQVAPPTPSSPPVHHGVPLPTTGNHRLSFTDRLAEMKRVEGFIPASPVNNQTLPSHEVSTPNMSNLPHSHIRSVPVPHTSGTSRGVERVAQLRGTDGVSTTTPPISPNVSSTDLSSLNNRRGLPGLSPLSTIPPPPSRSAASVSPSVSLKSPHEIEKEPHSHTSPRENTEVMENFMKKTGKTVPDTPESIARASPSPNSVTGMISVLEKNRPSVSTQSSSAPVEVSTPDSTASSEPKIMTIAERLAALKAAGAKKETPVTPPPEELRPVRRGSIADRIASLMTTNGGAIPVAPKPPPSRINPSLTAMVSASLPVDRPQGVALPFAAIAAQKAVQMSSTTVRRYSTNVDGSMEHLTLTRATGPPKRKPPRSRAARTTFLSEDD